MSSRAMKKLHGGGEIAAVALEGAQSDEEEGEEEGLAPASQKTQFNPFDLLLDEDGEENEAEVVSAEKSEPQPQPNSVKSKKKKKKKSKAKQQKTTQENGAEDLNDLAAPPGESSADLVVHLQWSTQTLSQTETSISAAVKALLTVEHKHLNAENEQRRIFGFRVVQAEAQRRRHTNRRQVQRSTWLVRAKDTWAAHTKLGLGMELIETRRGLNCFTFTHNKHYQEVQFKFWDAVETLQPQAIMNVLQLHPYHIDSLLQLSEVCKMGEDVQTATDLIERALFAFESAFHSMFSLTQGNCRLTYSRPENRAFFLALFRHLIYIGNRGCYRTALEICKLLLSLDPEGDPLCASLLIDFYALRAEEYQFIINMSHEWEAHRNLSQLPNFAFSVPLAMFHLAHAQQASLGLANSTLQRSLLMFPGLLLPLLDHCSVRPDSAVSSHSFFTSNSGQPEALTQLLALYVGRCHSCWKVPEVMAWLEENVRTVLARVDSGEPLVAEFAEKRKTRYRGTPRNIYRHILISEIRSASAHLPPEIAHSPILSYDPLPPTDNMTSYTRPERSRRTQDDSGALSLFFRSLLPNFNPQQEDAAIGDHEEGVARQNLQQGVGALMNAMRDLLNNIRPVGPPLENRNNGGGGEDEVEDGEWD